MAKITYNNPAAFAINDTVKELINRVADDTVNPEVVITSTLRSPEAQVKAMADNLYAGKRIRYRAPLHNRRVIPPVQHHRSVDHPYEKPTRLHQSVGQRRKVP